MSNCFDNTILPFSSPSSFRLYDVVEEEQYGLVPVDQYKFAFVVFHGNANAVGIRVGCHHQVGIGFAGFFSANWAQLPGIGRYDSREVATYHIPLGDMDDGYW